MQSRIPDLMTLAADGYKGLFGLEGFVRESSLPYSTYHLVKLRASQINGCAYCVDMHSRDMKKEGETDERLWAVAAWRESPHFTEAERAALGLAEAATRLADNPAGVPDDVWNEAAAHYDREALAALVMGIAAINAWNRISVTNRTVPGR